MNPHPKIRRATPDDAPAVAEIFLRARAGMAYLPAIHTDEQTRQWVASVMLPTLDVRVAELAGIAGIAGITGFAATSPGHLEHLYVDPPHQSSGVGTALLRRVRREQPISLRLWLFQKNVGARRFYERHGGVLLRETDGRENEEREPDAEYELPVPAAADNGV